MENSLFLQVLTLLSVLFVINCVCLCSHLLSSLSDLLPVLAVFAVSHAVWSIALRLDFIHRLNSIWIRLRYQFKILFILLILWLSYEYSFCQLFSCAFLNTAIWKYLQTSIKPSRNASIVEKVSLNDLTTTYKTNKLRGSNNTNLKETFLPREKPLEQNVKINSQLPSKKTTFPLQDPYEWVCRISLLLFFLIKFLFCSF
jgi:hypothetical protein